MRFLVLLLLFAILSCILADHSDEKKKNKEKHNEEDEGEPEELKLDGTSEDENDEYYYVNPDAMIEQVTSAPTLKTELPPNSLNTDQPSTDPPTTPSPPLGIFGPDGWFGKDSDWNSEIAAIATTTKKPEVVGGQGGMPCGNMNNNNYIKNPVIDWWDRVLMFLSFPIVFCFIAATTEMFGTKS